MSTRTAGSGATLSLRRDPVRLLCSAGLWSSAGFLAGYLLVSWVLFSVALTATVAAAVFAITLAGIPLLAAAAGVIRGCANVERDDCASCSPRRCWAATGRSPPPASWPRRGCAGGTRPPGVTSPT